MQYSILWLQRHFFAKKIFGKFLEFLEIFEDGNGWLEVSLDTTTRNGVPLELFGPKEFQYVDGKIRNRFCSVLEPVFQIFTISKTHPIPSIKPSAIQFLHIKHWFGPCDMVRMSQKTFLHGLYISYYITCRAVLIENHQFLYNEDPILMPFGPI